MFSLGDRRSACMRVTALDADCGQSTVGLMDLCVSMTHPYTGLDGVRGDGLALGLTGRYAEHNFIMRPRCYSPLTPMKDSSICL